MAIKRESFKQPIFITSTMENSNNAVDSVIKFHDVRRDESVFKLPISELSFNGTIKHVQKLTPIVDPISAMSSNKLNLDEKSDDRESQAGSSDGTSLDTDYKSCGHKFNETSEDVSVSYINRVEKTSESTGDSQYEEVIVRKEDPVSDEASTTKWNLDQSHSSFEASFDSGVRSPDLFSDNEDYLQEPVPEVEPFWTFLKDYDTYDKRRVRKI